jgi:hypothetical protein
MESSLSNSVFALDGQAIGPAAFIRGNAEQFGLDEKWLQSAIAENPELVLGPCRAAGLIGAEPWYFWDQEFEIHGSGSIDVLLLSASGRIGIVETKMAYNADKRRAVLAQILEYSLGLKALEAGDLPDLPSVAAAGYPATADVERHLAESDFLLIIAGDEIDRRVARLSRGVLGDNLTLPWDLALVEVAVYERTFGDRRERMVVPALVHRIEPEARQIVRVETSRQGEVTVTVTHLPLKEPGEGGRWTESEYLRELTAGQLLPQFKAMVGTMLEMIAGSADLIASYGKGNVPSMTIRRNRKTILEVYLDGSVWWMRHQVRAALGDSIGEKYLDALTRLFPRSRDQRHPHATPVEVGAAVRSLIEEVESAVLAARGSELATGLGST